MPPFDQHEPLAILAYQNRHLLAHLQYALGNLLCLLGIERCPALCRHIDACDWKRLPLHHGAGILGRASSPSTTVPFTPGPPYVAHPFGRMQPMSQPLVVSIPHRLGREEAVRRIKSGLAAARTNYLIALDI